MLKIVYSDLSLRCGSISEEAHDVHSVRQVDVDEFIYGKQPEILKPLVI